MLTQLTEHVWYLPCEEVTDRPTLGYVRSGRSSLMVDSGNSPDHISFFYGNVRSIGLPDPEYIILTHWHWDHVFGLSGSPAKSIAQMLTNERLINMQRWDWSDNSLNSRVAAGLEIPFCAEMIKREMPMRHSFKVRPADISFDRRCSLSVEDVLCEIVHVGGPHTDDSTVVNVPSEGVLFIGDCDCPDMYCSDGSLRLSLYRNLIERLESFSAKWIVTGHGEPLPSEEYFAEAQKIITLGELVGNTLATADCQKKIEDHFGREITDDELYYVHRFITGNRYSSTGTN